MNIRPECLDDDPQDQTCLTKPHMYIDPCAEEEWQDAPFCSGPSDQGEATPEAGPACAMEDRSARGYCPDEVEGHAAELCGLEIANDECPDAVELIPPMSLERDANLPDAGLPVMGLALPATLLIAIGAQLLRR